jgi:hypothetical protein
MKVPEESAKPKSIVLKDCVLLPYMYHLKYLQKFIVPPKFNLNCL